MNDKKNIKILLVDDSSTNNLLYQNILEEEGYNVLIAENGKKAYDVIKKEKPHIVLLDIMMPDIDGFDILEKIVKNEEIGPISVIMVTAKKDTGSMKKALNIGAVDYLIKPVGIDELLGRIEKVLSKKQL